MIENTQLLRGILEGCILAIINREESYGYLVIERLRVSGFPDIQESTVYPILNRLEKRGLFNCKRILSKLGPPRKYYSISENGYLELEGFVKLWKNTKKNVDIIIKEGFK
jgi:PadR family transcriptional regulator PadR